MLTPLAKESHDVLVISRIHMPESSAASFRLRAVERALVAAGARVRVLTTAPPPGASGDDDPGVEVSRWPALRDKSGYLRGYLPYMSFDVPAFFRILFARRARGALIEPPPTTGVVARCALALRRVPYVWYAPDVWSDATAATNAPGAVKRVVRAMESFAMRGARAVIAINDEVAVRARELGASEVVVVPNGIDPAVFGVGGDAVPDAVRRDLGIGEDYFVYAGTASEWQGAEVFIEALQLLRRQHPSAQIVFLGQGSAWPRLAETAAGIHGARGRPAVVFVPSVPPDEAAQWQRGAVAALVSIKPGIGYDFAYPTKVLAALSCGCPVVYSGAGPAREDIREAGLGWAVAHEARETAQAMVVALQNRRGQDERERLHAWVVDHRSIESTGRRAAEAVLRAIR